MGFIPTSTTKTLNAYLTPKGRYYILYGDTKDFQVKYFSLHDNDVNYFITSQIINSNYNKLPNGFVPDITGDNDDCIKSIAAGVVVDPNSIIIGGSPVDFKRAIYLGFTQSKQIAPSPNPTLNTITGSFSLELTPPLNDTTPLSVDELTSTSFIVYVVSTTGPIKNVKINGNLNQSSTIRFDSNTSLSTISFSYEKDNNLASQNDKLYQSNIVFGIKDLTYATIKGGASSLTYLVELTIKGTGGTQQV